MRAVGGCGPAAGPAARRSDTPARMPPHGWPQPAAAHGCEQHRRRHHPPRGGRAARPVWRAGSPDRPATLVHGDWHLGQLGRRSATTPWMLIDVDDLGVGDPAWDLARPGRVLGGRAHPRRRLDDVPRRVPRRGRTGAAARRPVAGARAVRPRRRGASRRESSRRRAADGGVRADGSSWRRTACRSPACGSACCRGGPSPGRSRSRSPAGRGGGGGAAWTNRFSIWVSDSSSPKSRKMPRQVSHCSRWMPLRS